MKQNEVNTLENRMWQLGFGAFFSINLIAFLWNCSSLDFSFISVRRVGMTAIKRWRSYGWVLGTQCEALIACPCAFESHDSAFFSSVEDWKRSDVPCDKVKYQMLMWIMFGSKKKIRSKIILVFGNQNFFSRANYVKEISLKATNLFINT